MTLRDQLSRHISFFEELGVNGLRRELEWRQRQPLGPELKGNHSEEMTRQMVDDLTTPPQRMNAIRDNLGDCRRCKLYGGRTRLVFGVGDPMAEWMFVGEAPGGDEDREGIPFVGRAWVCQPWWLQQKQYLWLEDSRHHSTPARLGLDNRGE